MLRPARPDELPALVVIDDEASELYAEAGIVFGLAPDHPFVLDESVRWERAIALGLAHVAVDAQGSIMGFVTLGMVDGQPYVDQLAVRPAAMRQGMGSALLKTAIAWSGGRPLWLTTYAHLPWNRPYYERHGFVAVEESDCGPEICAILAKQRAALPAPDQRIAMARRP